MKYPFGILHWLVASLTPLAIASPPVGAPSFDNEQLHYNINWPSGLSLGEAALSATGSKPAPDAPQRLHLQFDIDAGVPGFSVTDRYRSEASGEFCSSEFDRTIAHGQKKTDEKTTFDSHNGSATRQTVGGDRSEMKAASCSRDALTFLYYVRRELSEGRMPAPQTIFLGAPYEVRLEFHGTENIRIGDKPVEADRFAASVKGPASSTSFDIFFLKDRARTPALVRVPLAMGTTFSMELVK
jgi:hypothetical protein